MTKRDFEAIAAALGAVRPWAWANEGDIGLGMSHQWTRTVDAFAAALASTNPRFDRERFVSACKGVDSTGTEVG